MHLAAHSVSRCDTRVIYGQGMRTRGIHLTPRIRLGTLAFGFALAVVTGCGSSGSEAESVTVVSDQPGTADTTAEVAAESDPVDETVGEDDYQVDDCDYSTFVYTPFTEIPADWPATFPAPEQLEEVKGDVGVGCGRITVDMRGRYYGSSREWVAEYGDALSAAGFELDDEYDELGDLIRTYRSGQDVINYGGPIELEGKDGEYIGVGIVLTDFAN